MSGIVFDLKYLPSVSREHYENETIIPKIIFENQLRFVQLPNEIREIILNYVSPTMLFLYKNIEKRKKNELEFKQYTEKLEQINNETFDIDQKMYALAVDRFNEKYGKTPSEVMIIYSGLLMSASGYNGNLSLYGFRICGTTYYFQKSQLEHVRPNEMQKQAHILVYRMSIPDIPDIK